MNNVPTFQVFEAIIKAMLFIDVVTSKKLIQKLFSIEKQFFG